MFWVRWINFVNGICLVHPKNENCVINYLPSCSSKPIRLIKRLQMKRFLMKSENPREYHDTCVWCCQRRIQTSINMHLFYNVFLNVLECHRFGGMDFHRRGTNLSGFINSIFICVLKIHKSLVWNIKGWVSNDIIFIFVWNISLNVCWRWSLAVN